MRLLPLYQETITQAKQTGIQLGEKRVIENLLRVHFGELDAQLTQIIDRIVLLSPEEFTPLLLQLSREELITRFQSENQLWEELNTIV